MQNDYHFITHWHVSSPPDVVYRTLEDIDTLARWWPSVYLDVKVLEQGQSNGVGKVVELFTKGWLPYTLRWKFRVRETHFPTGFTIDAFGDFVGQGIWTFTPENEGTYIVYDWRVGVEKPLLKHLSFLMKPLFAMNHEWAMKKGEESLKLELQRRNGGRNIPSPPKPTFPHNFLNKHIL